MIALYVKPAPKVPMCQNPNMGLLECEVSDYKNARAIRPVSHAWITNCNQRAMNRVPYLFPHHGAGHHTSLSSAIDLRIQKF